jgi:hypothetical protein
MMGVRFSLETWPNLLRNTALPKIIQGMKATSASVDGVAKSTGVSRRQAFRLIALAKPLSTRYEGGYLTIDPHELAMRRVFRKGVCEVLSCCLEFAPVHLRDIARLSRLPLSTAQLATKLLIRHNLVQEQNDECNLGLGRLLRIPQSHLVELADEESVAVIQDGLSDVKELCHAVVMVSPAQVVFIAKNACLKGEQLQRLVGSSVPMANRTLTDRNSWLSIGLRLVGRTVLAGVAAKEIAQSIFGLTLIGQKPRPSDLFSAVNESAPEESERRTSSWIERGYVKSCGDRKMFTRKGVLVLRHRYSHIGIPKMTEIKTAQGFWKLFLV